MKKSLSALALTGALAALDGCTATPNQSARVLVPQCADQRTASSASVSPYTPATSFCDNPSAENYLRSRIEALRPTTPRAMRYDTRRILMIALAEHEGVEEPVLQAALRREQELCIDGEKNVGIIRTQIYGASPILENFHASSYAEEVVFTGINNGQFSIVPNMRPQISGDVYTCLPNVSNYYYRYHCDRFPRDLPVHPLANWGLELFDRPGVAICFSPGINEPTICGFQAMSEYANRYGSSPGVGISMRTSPGWGNHPASITIN